MSNPSLYQPMSVYITYLYCLFWLISRNRAEASSRYCTDCQASWDLWSWTCIKGLFWCWPRRSSTIGYDWPCSSLVSISAGNPSRSVGWLDGGYRIRISTRRPVSCPITKWGRRMVTGPLPATLSPHLCSYLTPQHHTLSCSSTS